MSKISQLQESKKALVKAQGLIEQAAGGIEIAISELPVGVTEKTADAIGKIGLECVALAVKVEERVDRLSQSIATAHGEHRAAIKEAQKFDGESE